ncbi:MAG TPA: RHS repeat-associated core domain-containing protein, partial [Thermoanaerobaculia bacterium]
PNTAPPIAYEYIWFADQPLAQVDVATNQIHYYFNDHLGTPILQTDATARIVWQVEYEPYGTVYAARRGEAKHQPLRLPGQEGGGSGEVSYNVFRWYRSGWGRYTQNDPMGWVGQEYSYASGNPVLHTDRLGLFDTGSAAKDAVKKAMDACGQKSTSAWGGPVVGVIVSLIFADDLNPEEFESQPKKCHPDVKCKQNCRPCIPPVGTLAYREDTSPASPPHKGVPTPHWHLHRMNQNPYNCQCFWVPVPDNQGGFGPSPPPPGAVPITPAGGGGVW